MPDVTAPYLALPVPSVLHTDVGHGDAALVAGVVPVHSHPVEEIIVALRHDDLVLRSGYKVRPGLKVHAGWYLFIFPL